MTLLGHSLIKCGYTMTLTQAEKMVEAIESNEETGMVTDGNGNFFFVETADEKDLNPVSICCVRRVERGWGASIYWLGHERFCGAGHRLLVKNLDASKL